MTNTFSARLGLVPGIAALCLAVAPARAEEGVAIKNLLGNMGIISPQKDPIRYRERAPLVLPPKMELRAPSAGTVAETDPQWPKDPDVQARKNRAAEQRRPVTESEIRRMSENNPRLSPEDLRAGRDPSAKHAALDPNAHRGDNARDVLLLSPDELRAKTKPEDDIALANGEPERRNLTDPPAGMRKSATGGPIKASNAAPKIDQQEYDANPMNWLTRKFSNGDDD